MADIPVKRKSGVPWWLWLVGLLVLIGLLWFFLAGDDRDTTITSTAPAAQSSTPPAAEQSSTPPPTEPSSPVTNAPAETSAGGAATAAALGTVAPAPGSPITDPGIYSSTADKLSLVGQEAALSGVTVVRIVGPKTFTIASGSDELFVMLDQDLARGVGSQGQIDKADTFNVKGKFERLQQEEIDDVSNNRFRELTQQERETLRKTQVYLRATEFGKMS